jgi:hypothetical protein
VWDAPGRRSHSERRIRDLDQIVREEPTWTPRVPGRGGVDCAKEPTRPGTRRTAPRDAVGPTFEAGGQSRSSNNAYGLMFSMAWPPREKRRARLDHGRGAAHRRKCRPAAVRCGRISRQAEDCRLSRPVDALEQPRNGPLQLTRVRHFELPAVDDDGRPQTRGVKSTRDVQPGSQRPGPTWAAPDACGSSAGSTRTGSIPTLPRQRKRSMLFRIVGISLNGFFNRPSGSRSFTFA